MADLKIAVCGAIAANVAIATTKFIVAGITGSWAMLSDGIYSAVDAGNGGLLAGALGGRFGLPTNAWRVLTWGGLRGGISVALALSLPVGPHRDTVLALTYCVVAFSILVQGLTIGRVVHAS